jgi:hypothetical protein
MEPETEPTREDESLDTIRARLLAAHGPLGAEWKTAFMVEKTTLVFTEGQVILTREPGKPWVVVSDTTRPRTEPPRRPSRISALTLPNMHG